MQQLSADLKDLALELGATSAGIAHRRDLTGPPEADLTRVLPGAVTAVSFAVVEPEESISGYLSKKDPQPHRDWLYESIQALGSIGVALAELIGAHGHRAVALSPNGTYATDSRPGELMPPFSHRYGAHAAGVGAIGLSGNLMTPEHGARVYLSTVVTDAPLIEDGPLDQNPCDDCGLCIQACAPQFMSSDERVSFTLGGRTITHAAKGVAWRCGICCGGFTGLSRDGTWSTLAPSLREIPEDDGEALRLYLEMSQNKIRYLARHADEPNQWRLSEPAPGYSRDEQGLLARSRTDTHTTCGNCSIVCFETKRQRARAVKTLRNSGVVIGEREDRSPIVVSAQQAEDYRQDHCEPYMRPDEGQVDGETNEDLGLPVATGAGEPFFWTEPGESRSTPDAEDCPLVPAGD